MMKNTIIYVIAVIAATGGLLFGFDTGVISGAIPFFQKDFGLDNSMVELVTSAGLVGAILGALFCGKITDILGRKVVILASAVIFTIDRCSLVGICSQYRAVDYSPFVFGNSNRSIVFCSTSLYSRDFTG